RVLAGHLAASGRGRAAPAPRPPPPPPRAASPASPGLPNAARASRPRLATDPGSAKLYLPGGEPPRPGSTFRNPDLAALLETLAKRDSVASFYKGDVADRIAAAFRAHSGLVTAADPAAYQARERE